jgi:hypothetical protein
MDSESKYPLHDALHARREEHRAIVGFCNWLESDTSYLFGCPSIAAMVAAYFETDLDAFEAEKSAMLDELRGGR